MAEQVVNWMQKHSAIFPDGVTLEKWATSSGKEYLSFTDNYFWAALERILSNELSDLVPNYIKAFCKCLLHHQEPKYIQGSEIRIVSDNEEEIKSELKKSVLITNPEDNDSKITIMSSRCMSSQMPYDAFVAAAKEKQTAREGSSEINEQEISDLELWRLMECICVREQDGELHLLCDDHRSLMRKLYNTNFVVLRTYEFLLQQSN